MYYQKNFFYVTCILCILGFGITPTLASHIQGGEITYTQRQGLEYCFVLRLYLDLSPGNADSPDIEFDFGDGSAPVVVPRSSLTSLDMFFSLGTYEICHVFPANGSYDITVVQESRNASIINIAEGNSGNIPFAVRTSLLVDPAQGVNNSPVFLGNPIFNTYRGEVFRENMLAYDAQGDSLAYKLVNPLQSKDENAPYFLPEGFQINQVSGEIIWEQPSQGIGNYAFAVQIQKWRNGTLIGTVQRDLQIVVSEVEWSPTPPQLAPKDTLSDLDNPSGKRIESGEALSFSIILPKNENRNGESQLTVYSELLERGKAQVQTQDSTDDAGPPLEGASRTVFTAVLY